MPSESVEEYLEAIYRLSRESGDFGTSDLAAMLGVAAPSVTTMLGRLERDGFVRHEPYGAIELTDAGGSLARCVVRRHRLAERMLTDLLGLPLEQVHRYACELEHILDTELEQAVCERLNQPLLCPHGGRIDCADLPGARPLIELSAGDEAVVVQVLNEDEQHLSYLRELGLLPGERLRVTSVSPGGDLLQLEAGARLIAVGRDAASAVRVLTEDIEFVARAICSELRAHGG